MFVVILTYTKPLAEVDIHLVSHRAFLDTIYAQGLLITSGRQASSTGGVLLAHHCTRTQLETVLQQDPFYIADVATYSVYEFIPNKHAPLFAPFMPTGDS